MPTVNIFHDGYAAELRDSAADLRDLLAIRLSGQSRQLKANEISIRLIGVDTAAMIAPMEVEITAHHYPERIAHADDLCLEVRAFLMKRLSGIEYVRVWLQLGELGHSWHE